MGGKFENKQHKTKKPFYRRWWFWVIVVILLLGGCFGGISDSTEEPKPTSQPETTAAVETAEASSANDNTLNAAVDMIKMILKDNYENYEISSTNDMIVVNIWDDGIAVASTIAASGDEESKAAWDTMVESQVNACKSMREFVDTAGLNDVTVMINVLNDLDKDKTLLSIADGIVIYNAVSGN